jgi:hypothetical protein
MFKRELESILACVRCVNLQIIEALAYASVSSKPNVSRFIIAKISRRGGRKGGLGGRKWDLLVGECLEGDERR